MMDGIGDCCLELMDWMFRGVLFDMLEKRSIVVPDE